MASSRESTLVLWDIDQTLVSIGGVSRRIYEAAFLDAVGQPLRELADMTGRTERAIVADTLALHGIQASEAVCERFYVALAAAANDHSAQMARHGHVLPGARESMRALAVEGVVQSVVTGNIEPIAVIKLQVFGLADLIDFAVGGYGSDGRDRALLIRLAQRRACERYGRDFVSNRTVVIGDTPYDIAAARQVGVRSVGVASGSSSVEVLAHAEAHVVLSDLKDTHALCRAVIVDQ